MEFGDYSYDEPETAVAPGGFFSDFLSAAQDRLSAALAPMQSESSAGPTVGSQLFEAIYQYGAGKLDQAREKAVGAFLMTSEGRKMQDEGMRQTVNQYMPYIIVALVGFFLLGFSARR